MLVVMVQRGVAQPPINMVSRAKNSHILRRKWYFVAQITLFLFFITTFTSSTTSPDFAYAAKRAAHACSRLARTTLKI
jgi:hypothetical protein